MITLKVLVKPSIPIEEMLEHWTLQHGKDNRFHKKFVKEGKVDSTTYNIPVHLTRMIIHGLMIGIFGHFELPFLDTSSNFNVSYLTLCLRMLEDPMVDDFGNFFIWKGVFNISIACCNFTKWILQ